MAVVTVALSLSACAHSSVNREKLAQVKRVGLLAVVIDRVAPTPADEAVLRAAADRAVVAFEAGLARSGRFEVVPSATYRSDPEFAAMSDVNRSTFVRAEVKKLVDAGKLVSAEDQLAPLLALFKKKDAPKQEEPKEDRTVRFTRDLQGDVERAGRPFVAATGMPVFPYAAVDPRKASSAPGGRGASSEYPEHVREVLRTSAGALAERLGLDAMAVVYLRSAVLATVGINVISSGTGRGNDTIRMEPGLLLIGKDGAPLVAVEARTIDAITTGRAAVPVYRVEYGPRGDHVIKGQRFSLVLDLADPRGEVRSEYEALVDKAVSGFVADLDKKLAEK
jgi:hypothetical protein